MTENNNNPYSGQNLYPNPSNPNPFPNPIADVIFIQRLKIKIIIKKNIENLKINLIIRKIVVDELPLISMN